MEFIKKGGIGKVLFLQGYRNGGDLPRRTPLVFRPHALRRQHRGAGLPHHRPDGLGGGLASAARLRIGRRQSVQERTAGPHHHGQLHRDLTNSPTISGCSFTQLYFDPPGFSGIKERVFGSQGAIDLATALVHASGKRRASARSNRRLPGRTPTYLSLAAFIDNARGKKKPLNNADSARISTLTAMLGRKSIYERRVVTWDEVNGPRRDQCPR